MQSPIVFSGARETDEEVKTSFSSDKLAAVNPMDILLLEDNAGQRELFQECLRLDGHRITGVPEGRLALEALETEEVDLLITDRVLPDMDGVEIASHVKNLDPPLPVILITGYGDPTEIADTHAAIVDIVISKPVGIRELRQAICMLQADSDI
jgi:CheY-like chemotaxis protein